MYISVYVQIYSKGKTPASGLKKMMKLGFNHFLYDHTQVYN